MDELTRFGVSLPAQLIKAFDESIERKGYRTRSEAIRDMMRDYLVEKEWENNAGVVVGTVTIVYDHHTRELSSVLNNLQHDHHDEIICTTHVHMDHDNCLEVIVVKGTSERVMAIADQLISTRGVKHGKLVCTTTGEGLK
ncbi:MAG TPA: nickel-responsive transcriptional regulator NikR [Armatimonadota bacterium]|nr:nickel-responsive transcriptional regulator NikR [Armatimonadota bacterium]